MILGRKRDGSVECVQSTRACLSSYETREISIICELAGWKEVAPAFIERGCTPRSTRAAALHLLGPIN
jgi:hypothetical protein